MALLLRSCFPETLRDLGIREQPRVFPQDATIGASRISVATFLWESYRSLKLERVECDGALWRLV
jgi:hypothetical protein